MPVLQTVTEKRAEVKTIAGRMKELIDAPAGENGNLSAEQDTEFTKIHERQNELWAEIEAIEGQEARRQEQADQLAATQDRLASSRGVSRAAVADTEEERKEQQREADAKYERAFDAYLRYGKDELTPEARAILHGRAAADVDIRTTHNLPEEVRAQSVGQDTKGGFFVPEGFYNSIISATKQFGGMRQSRAFVLTTASGQDLPIPTDDDTGNTGAILSENVTDSEQDFTISQTVLHAYMYTSKIVKVSRQLIQDSAFDVQSFLTAKLGQRIGRITNTHFTTGDAAAKPQGLTVGATSGVTAAAVDDFTIDELLELKHSVDPSYRDSPQWMFKDATLLLLKKKKDGDGRPLWQSGIAMGDPNTIDGDPYIINQDMPTAATTTKPIAYGDLSNYWIRDVLGIQLLRLDERYADALQVGFLAFSRHDGVLVDAGQNPIKVITMA